MPRAPLTPAEAEQRIRDIGLGNRPRYALAIGYHVGLRFDGSDEQVSAQVVAVDLGIATVVEENGTRHDVTIPVAGLPIDDRSDADDVGDLIAADLGALPGLLGPGWHQTR